MVAVAALLALLPAGTALIALPIAGIAACASVMNKLEEAKKRDHRVLGKELRLFELGARIIEQDDPIKAKVARSISSSTSPKFK